MPDDLKTSNEGEMGKKEKNTLDGLLDSRVECRSAQMDNILFQRIENNKNDVEWQERKKITSSMA
jgi:hypothetical protein